jgi:hypothetical protein
MLARCIFQSFQEVVEISIAVSYSSERQSLRPQVALPDLRMLLAPQIQSNHPGARSREPDQQQGILGPGSHRIKPLPSSPSVFLKPVGFHLGMNGSSMSLPS